MTSAEDKTESENSSERVIKYDGSSHIMSARFVKNAGIYITLFFDEKSGYRLRAVPSYDTGEVLFERKYDLNGEQIK